MLYNPITTISMEELPVYSVSLLVILVISQVVIAQIPAVPLEAKRRCQHALTGHAMVVLSYGLSQDACKVLLAVAAAVIYYIRYYQYDIYVNALGGLLRPKELEKDGGSLPGAFYFVVGALTVLVCFPIETTRYAVECLSWADPMASFVGSNVRSPKLHSSATLAGCLASFVTAIVVGMRCLPIDKESHTPLLISALACSLAEAYSFNYDNFMVPLATAATWHVFKSS